MFGKNNLIKNKKGITDLIFVGSIILVLAIVILIGFVVTSKLNEEFAKHSEIPARALVASNTLTGFYPGVIDNTFLLFMIFMGIGAIILAALVRIHPIFIPLFIIALIFIIFLSGIFSNIYTSMASDVQLIAYADQLTMVTTIMNFLPLIIGIFGTLLMIVSYKAWSTAQ